MANRYFGIFQSGEIKCRGIELRRHDTPVFITELQQEALKILAQCPGNDDLQEYSNRIRLLAARRMDDLRHGRIPPEKLLIRQTLSRAVSEYKVPSPAAIAASQLEQAGKFLRPGQIVQFIYTLGEPGVRAWDLLESFNPRTINISPYKTLLNQAMETIIKSFGVEKDLQLPLPVFRNSITGCLRIEPQNSSLSTANISQLPVLR